MTNLLNILRTLEGAFGYFVPFLLLGLFWCPEKCWKNRRAALFFGVISGGLLLLYLVAGRNNPISRYFFVPVLLCCLFCGGGLAGILSKIKPALRPVILWSVCILICGSSALQIALRGRKSHIPRLTQKISQDYCRGKDIVIYSDQPDANKIAAFLRRKMIPCELIGVSSFDKKSFMVDLPLLNLNKKQLYLLTGIPMHQSAEDWKKELQSCIYLTPFDVVKEEMYRKRRLLLLRFNGKVGSRSSKAVTALPKSFPDKLCMNAKRNFQCIPLCDSSWLQKEKSFLQPHADIHNRIEDNFWQFNFKGLLMKQLTIVCCNEFYWPFAAVQYAKKSVGNAVLEKSLTAILDKDILPAEDPMLLYSGSNLIFPEGFKTNWSNFAVNQYTGTEYLLEGKEENGKFTGTVLHAESGRKKDVVFSVIRQSADILQKSSLKILWLANVQSNPVDISGHVAALAPGHLSVKRCLENVLLTSFGIPVKEISQIDFPEKAPDIVMLDIFSHNLAEKSAFEFKRQAFFDQLEQILQKLRKRFPHTQLMVLLPPVPFRRDIQLPRYRLSLLLHEFTRKYPQYALRVIDPVGAVGCEDDFVMEKKRDHYNAPIALSVRGKENMAKVVLAHVAHFLSVKTPHSQRGNL